MKHHLLLASAVIVLLPACEKVRNLKNQLKAKSPPSASAKPHVGTLVSEINAGGYDTFCRQPGRVVVIDFHADWCGPCRRLSPILSEIANAQNGLVLVGKINVDREPELASSEGVQGIPDVRIFRDGKQVDRFVGLPDQAEVRRRVESHLKGLTAKIIDPVKLKPTEPLAQPMTKDWLPPGLKRR